MAGTNRCDLSTARFHIRIPPSCSAHPPQQIHALLHRHVDVYREKCCISRTSLEQPEVR